ncbi:SAM-dependent methyltransferase [Clostridium felsineum]|uniref:Cyclopropane-fatty-acyl-phospholipid synthase n=1 Tax=Clostridium felsineum TaxID=36839 RepID=A0A1S8LP81_9CLOT|nr:cyclopropane-fatty-acyl-phospholipid synthase family protein [Clostridium felsineum]URZ05674.1 Cyclopropane-fatty-acyl-phospholipid synthase [Clostridium felsineum]URZ10713.1 Cyclopropane-fatty-acyl-phospholipid synthase [Clostridium felsineum]
MDTNKIFYKTLFKGLFSDACEIKFWDGETEKYGQGDSKFKIIFNEPISKADIIRDPSMAFGEGYMEGKFDIEGSVEDVIQSLYNNKESFMRNGEKYAKLIKIIPNSIKKSKKDIKFHYDIGNDFYKLWLDKTMTYSCGYFKSPDDTLEQAQKNKVEHILKKLSLKKDITLLDIGCGWGELITTAAKEYGVKALGVTLSEEQFKVVKERIKNEGLEGRVDVILEDYREIKNRTFDRVVSVGMIEHVGKENIPEYFETVNKLLNKGGISLLHCITGVKKGGTNTWINNYIFPGGYVPAVRELVDNIAEQDFYLVDAESLRRHYGRTLEHWAVNFENAMDEVKKIKDEPFIRMWRMYLNACAASFNSGNIDIHQFVFTKDINDEISWTREYMYK